MDTFHEYCPGDVLHDGHRDSTTIRKQLPRFGPWCWRGTLAPVGVEVPLTTVEPTKICGHLIVMTSVKLTYPI